MLRIVLHDILGVLFLLGLAWALSLLMLIGAVSAS